MEEKGWAITGTHGLYVGWWLLRQEAIHYHTTALGSTWQECKKRGDKAVRVTIKIINTN